MRPNCDFFKYEGTLRYQWTRYCELNVLFSVEVATIQFLKVWDLVTAFVLLLKYIHSP